MKACSLIFLLIMLPGILWADCDFELRTEQIIYTAGENNHSIPSQVTLTRKKDSGPHCNDYFLTFTKGAAGNYNRMAVHSSGEYVLYNLYKNSNMTGVLKEVNDAVSLGDVLSGKIKKDSSELSVFYLAAGPINAKGPPLAGRYRDNLKVHAYSGALNASSYEASRELFIELIVPKFIALSLVEKGEAYDQYKTARTIDFGELESRESVEFDVRIVSNAGYILKVSSLNSGVLKRLNGSGASSEIAYDFLANGIVNSLRGTNGLPTTISSAVGKTAAGGAQVPIKIIIQDVSNKDPGTYQDYLTLSVISNE